MPLSPADARQTDRDIPQIDLAAARAVLGVETFERGAEYAESGRVEEWWWDPQELILAGTVRGNRNRLYEVTAELTGGAGDRHQLVWSDCTCPVGEHCKHVASLLLVADATTAAVAAGKSGAAGAPAADVDPGPSGWQLSLDSLLPAKPVAGTQPVPIAIEITLETAARGRTQPALTARLVRPGKRGWVAGDLAWSKVEYLGYPYADNQLRIARQLLGAFRVASSVRSTNRFGYGGYDYGYGDVRSIRLSDIDTGQLWPLLEAAAGAGIRLIHQYPALGDVRLSRPAALQLDASAGADGLTLTPVLRETWPGGIGAGGIGIGPGGIGIGPGGIGPSSPEPTGSGGGALRPLLFVGASGHGVVCADPLSPQRLRLAPLTRPAPAALQDLALSGEPLRIPAAEIGSFLADYYPVLRTLADIISSDGTFTPPTIVGPELVVRADFRPGHLVDVTLEWAYWIQVGDGTTDEVVRVPLSQPVASAGIRDLVAESELAARIDAPLDQFGLRTADALTAGCSLSGLETLRFATELLPLLEGTDGVAVERSGELTDYRDVGDSLVIGVSTEVIPGETDWFDLGVSISLDGVAIPFVSVFSALAAGESHLLRPDGAYFALDKPELVRLRRLIEEARALTDVEDGPLRISRFQAGLFDELAALGVVERQAEQWQQQVAGLRALVAVEPAVAPDGLDARLREYQLDGLAWLSTLYANGLGGILADDMGLGKTLQTLALLWQARQAQPAAPPFLVVAPSSVVSNWASEARRFTPGLRVAILPDTLRRSGFPLDEIVSRVDVIVTSYTVFRLDFDEYSARRWSGLILDEAQYVKNRQAKTYQCVRKLAAPFKLAVTGTPMENNLMEMWALLSITAPGLFPNPTAFSEYFARPIERTGDVELLDTFRRRIKPLVKRRTKELVAADLPAKQEQVVQIELPPRHRRLYDQRLQRERQKVLGLLGDMDRNRFTILKSLTVLRQLALHPGLVDPADDAMPCAKIDMLAEQLADVVAGGHRALVFSQFTRFLGRVRSRLDGEGIEYCYLDGRTRNRAAVIDKFKDGAAPVFLISLKAGGFGLNLTEADYCFLLDPWWNPATEMQAIDRTHRIGQTRNVMVYRLISAGTIEEKVLALNSRKAKLFASVVDDGNLFGSALTADDIRSLLR